MCRQKAGKYNKGDEHNFSPFKRELDQIGFISQGSKLPFKKLINKIVTLNFPGIPDHKKSGYAHYSAEQKIK